MAQTRQRQRTRSRDDDAPIIPILARKVREVETKAQKGKLGPTNRTKFQVIALLMREERARVKADPDLADSARAELLKRLDGIAQILAKTAARDTSLIALLEPDASISTVAQRFRRDWLLESGAELSPDELIITREVEAQARARREPGHPGVRALPAARQPVPRPRLLEGARPGRARSPPRELGAARAAVQVVRDRLGRPGREHGPPRGADGRSALARADSS